MGSVTGRWRATVAGLAGGALLPLALVGCGGGGTGGGDTYTLIAGHQLAVDTPFDKGLHKFAELVEQKTNGQVTVEVHANAEIGSEKEMFQGMQDGTVDVAIEAPGSIAEFVPKTNILSLPFLITSREHRDAVIESPVAEQLARDVEKQTDIKTMGYFGGGIRNMFFTEPVRDASDIQGRLFRVQPSRVLTDSFKATGLRPTVVDYTELYNALQQGVVRGAENESVYIISQKFYEPAPHLFLTQHEVTIRPIMISGVTLDRLPDDLEQKVLEAGAEASVYEREVEAKEDDAALEKLRSRPEVTVTEADTEAIAAKVRPVWEKYAQKWGLTDALRQIEQLKEG